MNSKKQKPRPKREKVEDSENQQIEQSGTGTKAPKADVAYSTINSALIAILAALLEPEALKDNAGPAIQRAEQLVRAVPKYLTDKIHPNLRAKFREFTPDVERRIKEANKWGFTDLSDSNLYWSPDQLPDGAMTFEQAVGNGTCEKHKTVRGLTQLLESVGYPVGYLQKKVITKHGYQEALKEQEQRRRQRGAERKRESRKKSSSPKSSADKISRS
jgi:hypothetical protein